MALIWSIYHIRIIVRYGIDGPSFVVHLAPKEETSVLGALGASEATAEACQGYCNACTREDPKYYGMP